MSRKKRQQGNSTPPSNLSAFRDEERRWKSRLSPPDLSLAFDADNVTWDMDAVDGRLRGTWKSGTGLIEECYRVELHELAETAMGQTRWKGKDRQEAGDYAIVVPRIPGTSTSTLTTAVTRLAYVRRFSGFVFFPRVLPESLQRALVVETLSHAGTPNLTSLDAHYDLPPGGLWSAWRNGRGGEMVPEKGLASPERRGRVPVAVPPGADEPGPPDVTPAVDGTPPATGATVSELLPRLRWANVGWHYNASLFGACSGVQCYTAG